MTEVRKGERYFLIPSGCDLSEYVGYVIVGGKTHAVRLSLNSDGSLQKFSFPQELDKGKIQLSSLCRERFKGAKSFKDTLVELDHVLTFISAASAQKTVALAPSKLLLALLPELRKIGLERLTEVSEDFSAITIRLRTEANNGRELTLRIRIDEDFPRRKPTWTCDIPTAVDYSWNGAKSTLYDVVRAHEAVISTLSEFYEEMAHIDENSTIMEANQLGKAQTRRRIHLSPDFSMILDINPSAPRDVPRIDFFGAPEKTIGAQRRLMEIVNKGEWDCGRHVLANLSEVLGILGIDIVAPPREEEETMTSTECGICFNVEMEGIEPDMKCENPGCRKKYHRKCLTEWLLVAGTTKRSFNTLFGTCVYCEKPIVVQKLGRG